MACARVVLVLLMPLFTLAARIPYEHYHPRFNQMKKSLAAVKSATFSKNFRDLKALDQLPRFGPSFALKCLNILLSNGKKWGPDLEPRDAVVSFISISLLEALQMPARIRSPLREQIGDALAELLRRIQDNRKREAEVVTIINDGMFWTSAHLPYLIQQIKKRRTDQFALAIWTVGRELGSWRRKRLRATLQSVAPPRVAEYALLYLLDLSSVSDDVALIHMFSQAYRSIHDTDTLRFFPIGKFGGEHNSSDLSFVKDLRQPGAFLQLSDMAVISVATLSLIRSRLYHHEIRTVAAIKKAFALDPTGSSFYLRLLASGFVNLHIPENFQRPFTRLENSIVVPFRTNTENCEQDLE